MQVSEVPVVRGGGRGPSSEEAVLTVLEWKGLLRPSKAPKFVGF